MEQVRDQRLDNYCEAIGDIRFQMANLRADESGNLQGALQRMHTRDISSYRHAKVELLRSPGEEKIRARLIKDTGGMAQPTDAAEGEGDGQGEAAEEV